VCVTECMLWCGMQCMVVNARMLVRHACARGIAWRDDKLASLLRYCLSLAVLGWLPVSGYLILGPFALVGV
jgi:hypothetical protein